MSSFVSHASGDSNGCPAPALAELIEPYCFGELGESDQRRFEEHLLTCRSCFTQVEEFEPHVELLRRDVRVARESITPDMLSLLGISSRLRLPFAGHAAFVYAAATFYGLLFALPVLVEVAYEFDRFGALSLRLAPPAFLFSFAAAVAAFWMDVRNARVYRFRFRYLLSILLGSTVVLCAVLLPFLPEAPSVQANFQTYPVRLGYLKSVFYAWISAPLLTFWPFHFVTVMQSELARGRHEHVLRVLTRHPFALTPRGTPFIPVWVMAVYLAGLFIFNYLGLSHLFDNLRPGPYMALFMSLVLVRVTVWMVLAVLGVVWYANTLTEIKRECQAVLSLISSRRLEP